MSTNISTPTTWHEAARQIEPALAKEAFNLARLVQCAIAKDPHGRYVGTKMVTLTATSEAARRIDDVLHSLQNGSWNPPILAQGAVGTAQREFLDLIIERRGSSLDVLALLTIGIVQSHLSGRTQRRYAWPDNISDEVIRIASDYLTSVGVEIDIPRKGTYPLLTARAMCRATLENPCRNLGDMFKSIGAHIARSFSSSTLLVVDVVAGAPVPKEDIQPARTADLLSLSKDDLADILEAKGLKGTATEYRVTPDDIRIFARRRGVAPHLLAA